MKNLGNSYKFMWKYVYQLKLKIIIIISGFISGNVLSKIQMHVDVNYFVFFNS